MVKSVARGLRAALRFWSLPLSLEDRLFQQRYEKIREIESLGFEAYPRKYEHTHTLAQVRAGYDATGAEELEAEPPGVRVCGRLMTKRRQGRAGFCHLQKDGVQLQVYVRKDEVGNSPQNFCSGMLGAPQLAQAEIRFVPHSPQNLRPSGFSCWHFGHSTASPLG